jgi:hypothetical protein
LAFSLVTASLGREASATPISPMTTAALSADTDWIRNSALGTSFTFKYLEIATATNCTALSELGLHEADEETYEFTAMRDLSRLVAKKSSLCVSKETLGEVLDKGLAARSLVSKARRTPNSFAFVILWKARCHLIQCRLP